MTAETMPPHISEDMSEDMQKLLQMTQEELCEELLLFLDEEDDFVRHPFVHGFSSIPGLLNQKLQRQKEEYARAESWYAKLWLFERPWRLPMLVQWQEEGELTNEELRKMLKEAWVDSEFPCGPDGDQEPLVDLFREAGFMTDIGWEAPTHDMPVYRGGHADGMSWTLRKPIAMWFTKRYGEDRPMYQAMIPADGILAIFLESRGEDEVVVDPSLLYDVTELDKTGEPEPRRPQKHETQDADVW